MTGRYKYLQKPLEESALPGLLQYIHRWSPAQKDKLSIATGLLISQGLANASCLTALTKDHLVKNGAQLVHKLSRLLNHISDVSVGVVTLVFRAYLVDGSMDHLAAALKRGGVKDLLAFFPPNKRDAKTLEDHFKKEGLTPVAEWWAKKQYAVVKEEIVKDLREMGENEDSTDQVSQFHMIYTLVFFLILYCIDYCSDQDQTGCVATSRGRAGAVHLARAHVIRRLERPPRSNRVSGSPRSYRMFPTSSLP